MADNYFEKRMEEYREGKLNPKRRGILRRVSNNLNPGDYVLHFQQSRIVVFGGPVGLLDKVVREFRKIDCRVAICHLDSKSCVKLSQETGSRYYPFDPVMAGNTDRVFDDLTAHWGSVDTVIDLRDIQAVEEEMVERIAALLLIHSHPNFSMVRTIELEV